MYLYVFICNSETMEICHFKPVMDHHQKQPLSISISYLFETNFMLNKNTRCLKLIFLCQCVQYGPTTSNTSEPTLSHPNVSREFFTRPFSSVLHST